MGKTAKVIGMETSCSTILAIHIRPQIQAVLFLSSMGGLQAKTGPKTDQKMRTVADTLATFRSAIDNHWLKIMDWSARTNCQFFDR